MAYRDSENQLFAWNHLRIDTITDISISVRPITTKFGKQAHQEKLIQIRLIKQVLVVSSRQDQVIN